MLSSCASVKIKPVGVSADFDTQKYSSTNNLTFVLGNSKIPELELTTLTDQDFKAQITCYKFTWRINNIW